MNRSQALFYTLEKQVFYKSLTSKAPSVYFTAQNCHFLEKPTQVYAIDFIFL